MIVLIYLVKVALCQVLLYAVFKLLFQHGTHFTLQRFYLLSAALISFIIPYTAPLITWEQAPAVTYIAPLSTMLYEVEYSVRDARQTSDIIHWSITLNFIYAAGVILLLSRLAYGLLGIYRLHCTSLKRYYSSFILALTEKDISPFSFLHTIYFHPTTTDDQPIPTSILKHEMAHIHGCHSYDVILIELARTLLWFNPAIHLIFNELKSIHEYIADQEVLKSGQLNDYYQALIDQSYPTESVYLVTPFNQTNLTKRIEMMNIKKSAAWTKYKYLCAVPVLMILISAFQISSDNQSGKHSNESIIALADSIPAYKIVDEMPRFPGCENGEASIEEKKDCAQQKMLQYIYSQIRYPAEARNNNIQGTAVIRFIVETDGQVTNAHVIRNPGGGLSEESLPSSNP